MSILAIDTQQCEITGLYTMYTQDGQSFTFDNAGDVTSFAIMWYADRYNAVLCYQEMLRELRVQEALILRGRYDTGSVDMT